MGNGGSGHDVLRDVFPSNAFPPFPPPFPAPMKRGLEAAANTEAWLELLASRSPRIVPLIFDRAAAAEEGVDTLGSVTTRNEAEERSTEGGPAWKEPGGT